MFLFKSVVEYDNQRILSILLIKFFLLLFADKGYMRHYIAIHYFDVLVLNQASNVISINFWEF